MVHTSSCLNTPCFTTIITSCNSCLLGCQTAVKHHSNHHGGRLQLWCFWSEADEFLRTHFHSTFISPPVKLNFQNSKDFPNDGFCLVRSVRREIKRPSPRGLNWLHYHINSTETKNSVGLLVTFAHAHIELRLDLCGQNQSAITHIKALTKKAGFMLPEDLAFIIW